jgi:hypothetical protein
MDRDESINTVATTVFTTAGCLKTLLFSRRKRRVVGQTTVEFALICLPFFIILFAIIDFSEIFFYENSLQNALREACRFATAGRIIQAVDSSGHPQFETNSLGVVVPKAIPSNYGPGEASRNECIRYWFLSNCVLQNFPVSNIVITSAPNLPGVPPVTTTNITTGYLYLQGTNGPSTWGPGNYNDYVQITATYHVNTITPLMGYMSGYSGLANTFPVHVSAIIKNEPALLNFEHTNLYSGEPGESGTPP